MSFNSVPFLFFFPIVTVLYFCLPPFLRNPFLLAASCYFYMSFVPVYILILALVILVDYVAGIRIETAQGLARRTWLYLSLTANLGILLFFKFFFVVAGVAHFFNLDDSPIFWNRILLPIGLSFHTFQAMSYTIEVYRGNQKAERNPITYALYVMFYPQLVAGPIERPGHLIPQFKEIHRFDEARVIQGLRLMLWGMFKKVVIADRLAIPVNQVYDHLPNYQGFPLVFATLCFSFQIFCDFSGYSDIATGAAQVLGFRLVVNFNRPYLSASISEFWKRWHISLSSWFRDYVYIPLGGNRVSRSRHLLNLFFVFLLSGLWHGSRWNFVFWGGLNGLYLILSTLTQVPREKVSRALGLSRWPILQRCLRVGTVFSLTCFAWIFFRANSLQDAFYIVGHLGVFPHGGRGVGSLLTAFSNLGLKPLDLFFLTFSFGILEWVHLVRNSHDIREAIASKPVVFRWMTYYLLSGAIAWTWVSSVFKPQQFIYFQF